MPKLSILPDIMSLRSLGRWKITTLLGAAALLSSCGGKADMSPVRIDVVGTPAELSEPIRNALHPSGQVILAATDQGLVTFNASGAIIGALAERWIVEDNSETYIFRLKRARWANGGRVKADEVARLLKARMDATPQLMAGLNPEVKGMTDEVVQITLGAPEPSFLQLLAQPAMAIARPSGGTGPFLKTSGKGAVVLHAIRSTDIVEEDDGDTPTATLPPLTIRTMGASLAIARFMAGRSDFIWGLRFQHLPLIAVSKIRSVVVRADPVQGLFGLSIVGRSDFLANDDVREALNMAIDRDTLSQRLNVGGWQSATTILPGPLDLGRAPTQPSWTTRTLDQRQGYARSVVANWAKVHGAVPPIRIALPTGAGARILFYTIAVDLQKIGLNAVQVPWGDAADMRLIDEVAPFDSALWYLARLGCDLNEICDPDTDAGLDAARHSPTDADRVAALARVEPVTVAANNFIPLGMPIRIALVDPRLTGFQPSPRARHPLDQLFKTAQ